MCFDHQRSQKALTLHCPEMKGIRLGEKDLSPFTGDVLFGFFILKNGHNQKTYSKAQSFEVFQMICWEVGDCGTF